MIAGGAGRLAALGVQPREPGGGDVGEPFDDLDSVGRERAPGVRHHHDHVAHLALADDGHEQRGGDVEPLGHLLPYGSVVAAVGRDLRAARADDAGDRGRRAAERHAVLGLLLAALAHGPVLGDLEAVHEVSAHSRARTACVSTAPSSSGSDALAAAWATRCSAVRSVAAGGRVVDSSRGEPSADMAFEACIGRPAPGG